MKPKKPETSRTVSEFVVAAVQETASRTIEETEILRLSVEDQRIIAEAILNPFDPSPALIRASAAPRVVRRGMTAAPFRLDSHHVQRLRIRSTITFRISKESGPLHQASSTPEREMPSSCSSKNQIPS
jgi:hypothetical protein